MIPSYKILIGDISKNLAGVPSESIDCAITSTPYWAQRDYGHPDQIGMEPTPTEFVARLSSVLDEVKRVLKPSGTFWVNIGDTYSRSGGAVRKPRHWDGREGGPVSLKDINQSNKTGIPAKNIVGVPWMLAFEMRDKHGWNLRSEYPWIKTNPTPDPVGDRPQTSLERFFLFSKSDRYYFDLDAAKEYIGKSVWRNSEGILFFVTSVASNKSLGHATFPVDLISPMVLASCPIGGTVLDPFSGSGSSGVAAITNRRNYIGSELVEKEALWSIDRLEGIVSEMREKESSPAQMEMFDEI
jgi:site-specific DNA-methyltransferase (cytosine-N4-specific)